MQNFLPLSGVWYFFFKLYEPLFQSSTDNDLHLGSDGHVTVRHILCHPWYIGPPENGQSKPAELYKSIGAVTLQPLMYVKIRCFSEMHQRGVPRRPEQEAE